MIERSQYIQGLRDMADFFDARPDLPLPGVGLSLNIWEKSLTNASDRAKQMAPCEKKHSEHYFELRRYFGPHDVNVVWSRDDVCERVQVGTRHVPAYVVEAHDEPVYEWDCSQPLLLKEGQSEDNV